MYYFHLLLLRMKKNTNRKYKKNNSTVEEKKNPRRKRVIIRFDLNQCFFVASGLQNDRMSSSEKKIYNLGRDRPRI